MSYAYNWNSIDKIDDPPPVPIRFRTIKNPSKRIRKPCLLSFSLVLVRFFVESFLKRISHEQRVVATRLHNTHDTAIRIRDSSPSYSPFVHDYFLRNISGNDIVLRFSTKNVFCYSAVVVPRRVLRYINERGLDGCQTY